MKLTHPTQTKEPSDSVPTPLWVKELAAGLWQRAGPPGAFPRCLRKHARALRLSVVSLRSLSLTTMAEWLGRQGIAWSLNEQNRSVRACLFARGGMGIIFLDALDDENEQRFSLAHEIAHFLRDYWQLRQQAVERLGPGILAVLDGLREPTPAEGLRGVLRDVPLGFHTHLLGREAGYASPELTCAEEEADRLAFELLAPTEVLTTNDLQGSASLIRRLNHDFGLPGVAAERYANVLCPTPSSPDPLLLRFNFGKKLSNSGHEPGSTIGGSTYDG